MSIQFGSVCSGIEAASVAWHPLGWVSAWLSEVDSFASAVLAHHYPHTTNHGDMTKLSDRVASGEIDAPDVLVGGTPCQAFSVAGLRMSLSDARGNLSLSFVGLANAIDDLRRNRGRPSAVIVWENVPGVLNTSDNAFGCFLGGMAGCYTAIPAPQGSGWPDAGVVVGPRRTVAWRILDAQFFGLAQRRRRVFVVASARDGFDPAAVLFESEGVRRDFAPSREAREGAAAGTLRSTDGGSDVDHARGGHLVPSWPAEIASTLNAAFGSKLGLEDQHIGGGLRSLSLPTLMAHGQGGAEIAEDRAPTLTCNHEAPILFHGGRFDEVAHTLRGEGFDASEDGAGRGAPLVPVSVALRGRDGGAACEVGDDLAFTLRASHGGGDKPHAMVPIAFPQNLSGTQCASTENLAPAMGAKNPTAVATSMQVRRLTPRECERLQGFHDDYTLVPVRGKPAADGPRYKALGNSMAVPVMAWIGKRIDAQLNSPAHKYFRRTA